MTSTISSLHQRLNGEDKTLVTNFSLLKSECIEPGVTDLVPYRLFYNHLLYIRLESSSATQLL